MPPRARASAAATLPLGNRDSKIEQLLDHYNVQYDFLAGVAVSQIDIDGSRSNQARFKALDDETVAIYTAALEKGSQFPPVVAYKGNKGKAKRWTVIDGNHRTEAHRRARKSLDMYTLGNETPPDIIQFLTFEFNLQNGLNYTAAERVSHAADLVENYGVSQRKAAERYGVAVTKLGFDLTLRSADRRAIEADIDARIWDGLPVTSKVRLNAIRTDEVLKIAATLACQARLGTLDVGKLVTELAKVTNIEKQKAILREKRDAWSDKILATKAGKKKATEHTPKHRLALGLSQLVGLPSNVDALAKMYSGDERIDAAERLKPVVKLLNELLEVLQDA